MLVTHHHDIDVILSFSLLLWQNDLTGLNVVGIWNWLIEDTDASDNVSDFFDLFWSQLFLFSDIVRAADDHGGLGSLVATTDTADFVVLIEYELVHFFVKHESTAVEGALS